jgi:hypothetical protein
MPKILVEINDTLPDRVESAVDELKELLKDYVKENNCESLPDLSDIDYDGRVHELVDGCVPVYTKEIDDIWYLHKNKLVGAYEDAGIGDNPLENDGMSAIYCYIDNEVREWYQDNAQEFFDDIKSPVE